MKTNVVFYFLAELYILGVTSLQYDGYKVYETVADDNIQMEALLALEQSGMFDFWTDLRFDRLIDIMTAPDKVNQLVNFLTVNSIPHRLKINDVQRLINQQHSSIKKGPYSLRYNLTWDNYYRYEDIREFSYSLAASYPDLVTVSSVGRSYENREMILIKVSSGGSGTKNAIFVDSGIHACEWISPATGTYIIRELVENYVNQPQYVKDVDWFFMPLVNPDGYEFSHTDSRLWRKNRRPNDNINSTCIGTDINRNFDFHFGSDDGGSSDDPCRPTYNGGEAFSESESRALRDAILSVANRTKVYLTLHSYGQHWLTPWGYTNELPDDYDQLAALGNEAVAALTAVYGTEYDVGPSGSLLYTNSGPSDDWAKGAAGIAYSYTIELRDQGPIYGFLLPADQILPSGIETWEAFKVVANAVSKMT